MTEFRLGRHSVKPECMVVEIWEDGQMIGTIYPAEEGVRIVSKHLQWVMTGDGALSDKSYFPALDIRIVK